MWYIRSPSGMLSFQDQARNLVDEDLMVVVGLHPDPGGKDASGLPGG